CIHLNLMIFTKIIRGFISAALALDGATFSSETTLNNGTNTIPFQARYFATGAATPGAANADATFKVQYQ
ncbi:fimbrial protein, partial [Escherichia coli]|uniref:fimbrial protein n=1 Tax=Escherichia coli TaxID=562 RepID=UPI0031B578BE